LLSVLTLGCLNDGMQVTGTEWWTPHGSG
jgi:hypothetical protein